MAQSAKAREVYVSDVVDFLEYFAPPSLNPAEAVCGLQSGAGSLPVTAVILAPFVTQSVIRVANATTANLIVTPTPLITAPLGSFRSDEWPGSLVSQLLQCGLSLYTLGPSAAIAPSGFDHCFAERLGIAGTRQLLPASVEPEMKLVVFVPVEAVNRVLLALAEAGAGVIGNYTHCAFETLGTGSFIPGPGSQPSTGTPGRFKSVEEARLEMRVPQRELSGVLAALLDVHPYEEPAYDIYPLRNPGAVFSRGKLGELPLPVSMVTVLGQIEDALHSYGSNRLRSYNVQNRSVRNVAVVSGESDNGTTVQAALRANADVVILGSVSQQDQMMVDGHNTALVDTGYAPSLAPGLERLAAQLRNTFGAEGLRVLCAGRGH